MSATDRVAGELARRRGRVQDFIRDLGARDRGHRRSTGGALGEAVRRLPGLLRATRPALRALDRFTADAEPLVNRGARAAAAPDAARCASCARSRGTSPEPLRGLRATLRARPARQPARRRPSHAPDRVRRRRRSRPRRPARRVPRRPEPARLHRRAAALLLLRRGGQRRATTRRSHVFPSHVLTLPDCTTYAHEAGAAGSARARRAAAQPRARAARAARRGRARRPRPAPGLGPRRLRATPLPRLPAAPMPTEHHAQDLSTTCDERRRHGTRDRLGSHDPRDLGRGLPVLQREQRAAVRARLPGLGRRARRRPAGARRRRARRRRARRPGPGDHGDRAPRRPPAVGPAAARAQDRASRRCPTDSRAQVRPVSILGGKYLALEEGRSRARNPAGRHAAAGPRARRSWTSTRRSRSSTARPRAGCRARSATWARASPAAAPRSTRHADLHPPAAAPAAARAERAGGAATPTSTGFIDGAARRPVRSRRWPARSASSSTNGAITLAALDAADPAAGADARGAAADRARRHAGAAAGSRRC